MLSNFSIYIEREIKIQKGKGGKIDLKVNFLFGFINFTRIG